MLTRRHSPLGSAGPQRQQPSPAPASPSSSHQRHASRPGTVVPYAYADSDVSWPVSRTSNRRLEAAQKLVPPLRAATPGRLPQSQPRGASSIVGQQQQQRNRLAEVFGPSSSSRTSIADDGAAMMRSPSFDGSTAATAATRPSEDLAHATTVDAPWSEISVPQHGTPPSVDSGGGGVHSASSPSRWSLELPEALHYHRPGSDAVSRSTPPPGPTVPELQPWHRQRLVRLRESQQQQFPAVGADLMISSPQRVPPPQPQALQPWHYRRLVRLRESQSRSNIVDWSSVASPPPGLSPRVKLNRWY